MTTLYISDLDGTLLRSDATLSPFSRETLNKLLAEGLLFTVASARSLVTMQFVLAGLQLRLPVIEFNGTFISDFQTGRHLATCVITPAITTAIFAQACAAGLEPFVSTSNGAGDRLYYHQPANEGMQWHLQNRIAARDRRLQYQADLRQTLQEQVVCFTIIGRLDETTALNLQLQTDYAGQIETYLYENQYAPGWFWLTIHDSHASKGKAMQTVAELTGLSVLELVAFGDQVNDIAMLRQASRGIAVANAAPALYPYAAQVIGSHEEDSVVRFIAAEWHGQNGRFAT